MEMKGIVYWVAKLIEAKLCDYKEICVNKTLSDDELSYITQEVMSTMDDYDLTHSERCEVLNWFQYEYGLCL